MDKEKLGINYTHFANIYQVVCSTWSLNNVSGTWNEQKAFSYL